MDTLKYYENLVAAGSDKEQAKAHVYALHGSMNNLVTKDYLDKEVESIKKEIGHVRILGWAMFVVVIAPSLKTLLGLIA